MTEDPGGEQKLVRSLMGVGTEGGRVVDAIPPVPIGWNAENSCLGQLRAGLTFLQALHVAFPRFFRKGLGMMS